MSLAAQPLPISRTMVANRVRDYAELTKARVTTLVVLTAWCGYYFGAHKSSIPVLSLHLLSALFGVGLSGGGAAALNEVMEFKIDAAMRRTARRPLPAKRMSVLHGAITGSLLTLGGALYLGFVLNPLTGWLSLLTSFLYLALYTPLKRVHPVCTFIGAFPGAMPAVLGWTAARGRLDWEAFALFSIVFVWQFPHFFAIAWLYRDDYAAGGIKMLPVVQPDGRSTARRILIYSVLLIPVSLAPAYLGMAGRVYLTGAVVLGLAQLYMSTRLTGLSEPVSSPTSRQRARQLLRATITYLPLLFVLMMLNPISS
jgi:protoheme IX farnesyltransferase